MIRKDVLYYLDKRERESCHPLMVEKFFSGAYLVVTSMSEHFQQRMESGWIPLDIHTAKDVGT